MPCGPSRGRGAWRVPGPWSGAIETLGTRCRDWIQSRILGVRVCRDHPHGRVSEQDVGVGRRGGRRRRSPSLETGRYEAYRGSGAVRCIRHVTKVTIATITPKARLNRFRRRRTLRGMCHAPDSSPPRLPADLRGVAPVAGGVVETHKPALHGADGNSVAAFAARPAAPTGAGVVILPDLRGLSAFYEELAVRLAEAGFDAIAFDHVSRVNGPRKPPSDFDAMAALGRVTRRPDGLRCSRSSGVPALAGGRGASPCRCRSSPRRD